MKKFFVVLFSIILTIVEASLMTRFHIGYVSVHFSLVCVAIVGWLSTEKFGLINAIIVGAVCDVLASKIPCMYLILYVLMVVAVKFISKKTDVGKFYLCLLVIFCASIVTELINFLIVFGGESADVTAFALSKIILPQAFLNSVISLFLFWFFRGLCPSEQ